MIGAVPTVDPISQAILDAIDEPALIVGSGKVKGANQAAQSLLGGAIQDRDLRFAIRHPLALDTILAGRLADLELIGIGSAERPWHLSVRPLPGGTLVRLSDRSIVRAAERMRTDFVANASHELRTPLATIIGYAETLGENGPVDDEMRARFGATIEAEARRMLRIVEDLMSLSRIEADRYRIPDEDVDMGEVARIAIEHSSVLAERRGCRLEAADRGCDPGYEGRLRPASPACRQSDRQRHPLWLQRQKRDDHCEGRGRWPASPAIRQGWRRRDRAATSPEAYRAILSRRIRRAAANPAGPASALPSSNILSSGTAAKCGSILL